MIRIEYQLIQVLESFVEQYKRSNDLKEPELDAKNLFSKNNPHGNTTDKK